jgi:type VI secretion system protein
MKLKLNVISYKGNPPVGDFKAHFDQDGGTIGRSIEKRDNHLALHDPDKFISRRHATIKFEKGFFHLTDTSVDGTYILNKNLRVCQDTVALADGDKLKIGDYELSVQVQSNNEFASAEHSTTEFNQKDNYPASQIEDSRLHDAFAMPDLFEETGNSRKIPEDFNFEELITDLNINSGNSDLTRSDKFPVSNRASNLQDRAELRDLAAGGSLNLSGDNQALQEKFETKAGKLLEGSTLSDRDATEQISQQAQSALIKFFLEGAGVNDTGFIDSKDPTEFMKIVGGVFRELVEGLIALLQGRAELKAQFRVSATILKPADNNPLKFSPIIDEALKKLLEKKSAGFVYAPDAVREGFKDIKHHQLAMTAGIQAALLKVLERFDPKNFAKQYEEGLVFQRKAKSWDTYQQAYTEIAGQALEDFFGDTFVRAYEEQIRKLK